MDDEPPQSDAEEAEEPDPEESAFPEQEATIAIGWRSALPAFALLLLMCLWVKGCHQPPPVRSADAPTEEFSAERAAERLQRLLGDQAPHPIGTSANDQFRERLLAELTGLGLEPSTTDHWVSNEHESPALRSWVSGLARARNVIATMPTTNPNLPALILACHYDSVPAGPGASDDGAAVAALLEVARALKPKWPLARPVILLFTDGEELGLYGAQAFAKNNPLADPKRVGLVLNFEARGSSGPSLLFQTSAANRWIIEQASGGLKRPMSSSAYVEIYRLMPNDSDLTVFMKHGMPGMNFAFVRNPKHYHTPLDNLDNLDRRSLQHHGDNALGMVIQLLEADWEAATASTGDAVYTDLFARWIVAWQPSSGPLLAAFVMVVLLVVLVLLYLRRRWPLLRMGGNLVCWFSIILMAAVLSWAAALLLDSQDAAPSHMPDSMHLDVAVHCLFAAFGILIAIFVFRGVPTLFFLIHGILMTLFGFALASSSVAGFSYLFILPGIASAAAALFLLRRNTNEFHFAGACLLPAFVTAIVWLPLLIRMPLALGVTVATRHEIWVAPVFGVIFVILLLPLVPLLIKIRGRALLALSLGLAALSGWSFSKAVSTPPFTAQAPQQINLLYLEEADVPQAKLVIQALEGRAPGSFAADLPTLDNKPPTTFAGVHRRDQKRRAVAVTSAKIPPPSFELLSHQTKARIHTARFRLKSSRDSQYLMAGIPDTEDIELQRIEIAGVPLPVPPRRVDDHRWLRVRGAPPEGIEIELSWSGPTELPVLLAGITSGLPPTLRYLAEARDGLPACSAHRGDQTIAIRRITLR